MWPGLLSLLLIAAALLTAAPASAVDDDLSRAIKVLAESPHATERQKALQIIGKPAGDGDLPAEAIEALEQRALTDEYISNRLIASQILVAQAPDPERRQRLGEMWVSLLTFPVKESEVWRRFLYPLNDQRLRPQAVSLLATLHDPPYPDAVVTAWIHQLRTFGFDESLRLLRQVRASAGFTDAQRTLGAQIALRNSVPSRRELIYRLFARDLTDAQIAPTLTRMQEARSASDIALAATELLVHFEAAGVPVEISAAAFAILSEAPDEGVRLAAARLVAAGKDSVEVREERLIEALRRGRNDHDLAKLVLTVHGPEMLEASAARLLSDNKTPIDLRIALLTALADQAKEGRPVSANTMTALKQAAVNSDNFFEIAQIARVYETSEARTPLVVWLKSRKTQSSAVGLVFLALLAINSLAGLYTLGVLLFRQPPAGASKAGRGGKLLVWLVLSIVMLGLAGWAFLGFIGHNYAPAPKSSLMMSVPLYIGTVLYLPIMWILGRREVTTST